MITNIKNDRENWIKFTLYVNLLIIQYVWCPGENKYKKDGWENNAQSLNIHCYVSARAKIRHTWVHNFFLIFQLKRKNIDMKLMCRITQYHQTTINILHILNLWLNFNLSYYLMRLEIENGKRFIRKVTNVTLD